MTLDGVIVEKIVKIDAIEVGIDDNERLAVFSGGLGLGYDIKHRSDIEIVSLILTHAHCSKETARKIYEWGIKQIS